jgi:hypothetical protein
MQESMRSASRWLVWFCLSLTLWTAAVESSHHHPNKTESAACSICVVAHSTTPTASSNHTKPFFIALDLLQEQEIIAEARVHYSDLGIRGPPAA